MDKARCLRRPLSMMSSDLDDQGPGLEAPKTKPAYHIMRELKPWTAADPLYLSKFIGQGLTMHASMSRELSGCQACFSGRQHPFLPQAWKQEGFKHRCNAFRRITPRVQGRRCNALRAARTGSLAPASRKLTAVPIREVRLPMRSFV